MICMTFNYWGLASAPKKLALKCLVNSYPIDVIFLQENLGDSEIIIQALESLLPWWQFVAFGLFGNSTGLDVSLNSETIKLYASWGFLIDFGSWCFLVCSRHEYLSLQHLWSTFKMSYVLGPSIQNISTKRGQSGAWRWFKFFDWGLKNMGNASSPGPHL